MEIIDEKKFNRSLIKKFSYNFSVDSSFLCLIEITASAKSWWQNFLKLRSFFKDDDLAVEIDSIKFPKLDGRHGLFDGEAAWNGNNLKGLSKTNLFFIRLEGGEHALSFSSDQKPILESIKIYQIQQGKKVSYIPSINNPAQDGNRRQWLTLVLVDLSIKSLIITAKAQGGKAFSLFKRDDSDIKLIIDGQIQKNDEPKSHKYWHWCGRTLKRKTKNFSREFNLSKSLHYIELWADRSPEIGRITMEIGDEEEGLGTALGKVALYKDITNFNRVNFRSTPRTEDDNIIGTFSDGEEVEILNAQVIGEWVEGKSYIWHKIRFGEKIGYILSSFIEIDGQGRETVIEKIRQKARELGLEEGMLVALAGCESRFKPYATSKKYNPDDTKLGKGIFQITDQLKVDLNNSSKPFFSEINDSFRIDQNIGAGAKYFQWLYQERYGDDPDRLRKVVVAYNAGPYAVPVEEPLQLSLYDEQTQQLVACVEENSKKRNWQRIFWPTTKKLLVFVLLLTAANFLNQNDFFEPTNGFASAESMTNEEGLSNSIFYNKEEKELVFYGAHNGVIGEIPYSRLQLETIFQVPYDLRDMNSMRFMEGTQTSPYVFYFFASTFYACGAQNCTWALYRYDTKKDTLDIVENDIFGAQARMIPSPDFSKFIIRRDVHGSACDTGSYLSIFYSGSDSLQEVQGFDDEFYPTAHIVSLLWQDENHIKFTARYRDCSNLSKPFIERNFIYLVKEEELTWDNSK